ncbi:hypothetical protein JOM56_005580 [Amanita muscaria]
MSLLTTTAFGALFIPFALFIPKLLMGLGFFKPRRFSLVPPEKERVVILGATSGIGRAIAVQYAQRGASVCVVGRRENLVNEVVEELKPLTKGSVLGIVADFSEVEDVVRVRDTVEKEWGGLDTLAVVAGVASLQPLLDVAGVENSTGRNPDLSAKATIEGIQHAKDVALAAVKGNFTGPLVTAIAFIPLLQATSASPSIFLMSSPSAVIPTVTKTLYSATKASSLLLYQSLSIEHPKIKFTHFLPGTFEGEFRTGAVDGGPIRDAQDPNKFGMKKEYVAKRSVLAVDRAEKHVFLPWSVGVGHFLYWIKPSIIEKVASKKYSFDA